MLIDAVGGHHGSGLHDRAVERPPNCTIVQLCVRLAMEAKTGKSENCTIVRRGFDLTEE